MMDDAEWAVVESEFSASIVQRNRHRSCPPFEWFGPDPEPQPAGRGCSCAGCNTARRV